MKLKNKIVLAALTASFLTPAMAANTGGLFGNSPTGGSAFDFIANGGMASGGAVTFTPLHDFSFTSITVWLTGYTGLDMYGNSNQSFYAGIYSDDSINEPGYTSEQPGALITGLDAPAPNDGSQAAFEFVNLSPETVLQANTKYWLFIYENTSGSFNYDSYPQWVEGSSPVGDGVVYNGSQDFWAHGFSPSSATPAFAINAVPEPGPTAIFVVALLIWGTGLLQKRRNRRLAPVTNTAGQRRA